MSGVVEQEVRAAMLLTGIAALWSEEAAEVFIEERIKGKGEGSLLNWFKK